MADPIVSHGRGGAANISKDSTPYTDGGIIREGPVGDQGNGAYSAGRGGVGNIGSPGMKAQKTTPGDSDVVPETTMRLGNTTDYHVGRGGEGNRKNTLTAEEDNATKFSEKIKHKLFGKKEEKKVGKEAT